MSGELRAMASSEELSGAELAARTGVGEQETQRLVTHGVLVPRPGRGAPFRAVDVLKIRLARACEEGGLPMEGIAEAVRAGHLSFAFVESWPLRALGRARPGDPCRAGHRGGSADGGTAADRGGLWLRPARAR